VDGLPTWVRWIIVTAFGLSPILTYWVARPSPTYAADATVALDEALAEIDRWNAARHRRLCWNTIGSSLFAASARSPRPALIFMSHADQFFGEP
jgi:hypothetical protein